MKLGLSLGDHIHNIGGSKPVIGLMEGGNKGFCMALSIGPDQPSSKSPPANQHSMMIPAAVVLDLLPNIPVLLHNQNKGGGGGGGGGGAGRSTSFDHVLNSFDSSPPPNSTSHEYNSINNGGGGAKKRDHNNINNEEEAELVEAERTSSRAASDEDENASSRKKLRLTKQQSASLEETFKQHNTLNPKQKVALANQLNLRPRQVEVWFQNRRARTKLKQTEVDCEYLKRCCETLTEEKRRLQKELQDLRAIKTSSTTTSNNPFYTLTMCPSCERVAPTTNIDTSSASKLFSPIFYQFPAHKININPKLTPSAHN